MATSGSMPSPPPREELPAMLRLTRLDVPGTAGRGIELVQGDLTVHDPKHPFDLLVVSAFPGDYLPVPGTLIGALHEAGLSVDALADDKALDLRTDFACWLSKDVSAAGLGFRRVLCFEPRGAASPPERVGDLFRALVTAVGTDTTLRSVAMPVLASGNRLVPLEAMLAPLLDAALHWLALGGPIDTVKIAVHSEADAKTARPLVEQFRSAHALPPPAPPPAEWDVFLSYARTDAKRLEPLHAALREAMPGARVFLDRLEIDTGESWQGRIFASIDRCRRVLALLSPAYVHSKICQEEFNLAWRRGENIGRPLLYPVYLHSAELPTLMTLPNFIDCREGRLDRLAEAGRALAVELAAEPRSG
jgi:hypothetical protein